MLLIVLQALIKPQDLNDQKARVTNQPIATKEKHICSLDLEIKRYMTA